MAITTYTLSGTAFTSDGSAIENAVITAKLDKPDYTSDGSHLPRSQQTTADSSGDWSLELVSNLDGTQDSRYIIEIRLSASGGLLARETIQMPQAASTLAQLVVEQPVTTESQTAAALSAAKAEEEADRAQSIVNDAITDIESARDSALTAIGTAETDAVTAVNDARDQGVQAVQDARDQGVGAVEAARDDAVNTINGLVTQAESARDAAQGFRNEAEGFRDTAQTAAGNASDSETAAGLSAQSASDDATAAEGFRDAILSLLEERTTPIDVTGTSIDLSEEGIYYRLTLDGNVTLTFDNPSANINSFTIQVDHVSGEITWPASVVWPFDTPPVYTDGNTHLFMFVSDDGGTTYRGAALVDYPS